MNISCKCEKASYNIFVTVASQSYIYRHIYAVKGTILSHFSRPKVTLKTIAKVNKLDAGTPSCTEPQSHFQ